jgi:hypothetical protein
VLLKGDGQLVWHPNSTLRTQPLVNLSRSQPRWEGYTWLVDMDTPNEVRLAACSIHKCLYPMTLAAWTAMRGGIVAYSWWQQKLLWKLAYCYGTVGAGPY